MSMTYKLSEIMPPAFFELHRRIRAGEVTEALCEGGRGGAKSSFISEEIELQMMRHPDTHAVVLRRKENTLRRTVYNQYIWAAGALGVGSKWKATVSPMELTYLPTGQKIMFFGLDDPGNLKSIKLPFGYVAYVHFEELDQFRGPEEVRNVEQSLLRGGPIAITFKSFNPPASAANWANQYARESKPGQVKHHSTYLETPPEWLGPRFIADAEHLKALRPMAYRNEYLGEVTGGGVPFRDQTTDLYLSMDLTGDMGQGDPFRDYTPALRVEEYQKAIDIQCRLLERQTGFSPGTFSFDLKSGRMTATQVVSDDKETYNTTKAIQENGLRQGLLDLMYAYDIYATLYGLAPAGAFDPSVSFGDSIFEDTGVEFARRKGLVDSGYLRPELLVGWYFGVSEQEAREKYMPEPRPMLRFPEE